jgi:hypothetical protein
MVTGHGNAVAAGSRHIGGRPAHRAGQGESPSFTLRPVT